MNDLLVLSKNGAKKTQLLYQGNLSYSLLCSYLNYLLEQKLLEEKVVNENDTIHTEYTPTQKGLDLLENFEKIFETLKQ